MLCVSGKTRLLCEYLYPYVYVYTGMNAVIGMYSHHISLEMRKSVATHIQAAVARKLNALGILSKSIKTFHLPQNPFTDEILTA